MFVKKRFCILVFERREKPSCRLRPVLFSRCEDRGYSLVAVHGMGFSFQWLLLLWGLDSKHVGFRSCNARAQESWCTG